jgi:hypothetical protein
MGVHPLRQHESNPGPGRYQGNRGSLRPLSSGAQRASWEAAGAVGLGAEELKMEDVRLQIGGVADSLTGTPAVQSEIFNLQSEIR